MSRYETTTLLVGGKSQYACRYCCKQGTKISLTEAIEGLSLAVTLVSVVLYRKP